jgi:hypothetical protein
MATVVLPTAVGPQITIILGFAVSDFMISGWSACGGLSRFK